MGSNNFQVWAVLLLITVTYQAPLRFSSIPREAETWNMDPTLLEKAIEERIAKTGKKPRASFRLHYTACLTKSRL